MSHAGVQASLAELVALRGKVHSLGSGPARTASAWTGGQVPGRLNRGMEYAESRAYRAGDDVRSIDWRQTARRGTPYTKLYREEHARPVHLLVDLGASMRFGTRTAFKSAAAARAAALLAWQAVENGDRVGGIVCGDGQREVRPQGRHPGALSLLRQLAAASASPPAGASLFAGALPALARLVRPGGLSILIGDFTGFDAAMACQLTALALRGELALVLVHDRFESEAPPPGMYPLCDGQRGMTLDLRSDAAREAHVAPFAARRAALEKLARHPRIRLLALATDADPAAVLRLLLHTPHASPVAS